MIKTGWGQSIITPRGGKVVIAGMVPWRTTDVIHDEIRAVCMIIESEMGRTIWVSCDFCHPTKRLCNDVIEILKSRIDSFDESELILNGTHATACFYLTDDEFLGLAGPMPDSKGMLPLEEARRQICEGIYQAVCQAIDHLEETEISRYSDTIPTGVCRRVVYLDGSAEMYGDVHRPDFWRMEYPDGTQTNILYFHSVADHKLKGIFANVPCPSQADESSCYITSDYWGVVREIMEEQYGDDVCVISTCRAAGELSPHRMLVSPDDAHEMEWGRGRTEELGKVIAECIQRGVENPQKKYSGNDVFHKHIVKEINFPVRQYNAEECSRLKEFMGNPENFDENGNAFDWAPEADARHAKKLSARRYDFYTTKISTMILGDMLFFTAPVELYTEYAHRIAMQYRDFLCLDVQLTFDYMGYLPTKEAICHGGYSTLHFSTITGPDGGELYINETKKMLDELIEKERMENNE